MIESPKTQLAMEPVELLAPGAEQRPSSRGFFRQALHDTFGQFGARLGSVWVVLLVLAGVAAPYIASSHPIIMKLDGQWTSPMWQYLTPVDLVITSAAITVVVLLLTRQLSFGGSLLTLVLVIGLVTPTAYMLKSVPKSVNYQQYRDLERSGRVESIVRTLIPYSPSDRLRDMPERRLTAPGRHHWLGTETNGADVLSRMIHASRIALSIGFISTGIAVLIGIIIGGLMGYFVGRVDLIGMRLIEIFEAIPPLIMLITVTAAYGRNLYFMMVVIGLLSWTGTARFIRAEFLRLRSQDFVQAARALGLPTRSIIFRHVLPNGITPVLVTASFGIASAILTESTLSFLGLGLIDEPSWGQMLNQARSGGQGFVWWMALFPGLAIFLTVYAYSLIGDAMRDALDPKLRKRD